MFDTGDFKNTGLIPASGSADYYFISYSATGSLNTNVHGAAKAQINIAGNENAGAGKIIYILFTTGLTRIFDE
jgi:hypothetical protein